jgi:hypothetical protein
LLTRLARLGLTWLHFTAVYLNFSSHFTQSKCLGDGLNLSSDQRLGILSILERPCM